MTPKPHRPGAVSRWLRRSLRRGLRRLGYRLERRDETDEYLEQPFDRTVPLPPGAEQELRPDAPRLEELRASYAALDLPVVVHSRWREGGVLRQLDLRYFRGDNPFVWHYRENPQTTRLKYYARLQHVRAHDDMALLDRLEEDGAFGCWTFEFGDGRRISRDLLDSVCEINFLERHLDLSSRASLRVVDIGAGYGRLAHRMTAALPNVADYLCLDAVPEATFLAEYYLRHRASSPPARVVALDQAEDAIDRGAFDLAVNVHSFSECTYDAVAWWVDRLREAAVPYLLIVPNEPDALLTTEQDGEKRNFAGLLDTAGYRLLAREPKLTDPTLRALLDIHDRLYLFRHETAEPSRRSLDGERVGEYVPARPNGVGGSR